MVGSCNLNMLKRLYKTNLCHEFCINENNSFLQIMFCDELDLVEFLLFYKYGTMGTASSNYEQYKMCSCLHEHFTFCKTYIFNKMINNTISVREKSFALINVY